MGKIDKYKEVDNLPNVFTEPEEFRKIFDVLRTRFDRVIVELGSGHGDWLLKYAQDNPQDLFVAIEIKGDRIWHGAKEAHTKQIENILFIHDDALKFEQYFPTESIDELWIQFPEPLPKKKHEKRRFTAQNRLEAYHNLLKPKGKIVFKTDEPQLFQFTLKQLKDLRGFQVAQQDERFDLYRPNTGPLSLPTYYEQQHLEHGREVMLLVLEKN
ncbi:MAG: tRNA (guanosine(46)-N7)-methyltransferase TrmB [Chlorobi bacterium]|nr:tRNA (guanosine(46)-N7)-methyltransferase TrmB [Chlorobiota bacterium]